MANADPLNIGQPAAAAAPVRVAHLLAEPRLFTANFTSIRHAEGPPRERREDNSDFTGCQIGAPYTLRRMSPNRLSLRPQDLKQVLNRYLERLREYREALNRLNVYPVPDGDTGPNMTLTVEAVVAEVESAESMEEVASALAHGALMGDPDSTAAAMAAAVEDVTAGEVTQAVSDATTPAGSIREGDWLGIVSGDVRVIASDCAEAASGVLEAIIVGTSEVITIVTGSEADEAVTESITSRLGEEHADVAVDVVYGGQPLYPYLLGVE